LLVLIGKLIKTYCRVHQYCSSRESDLHPQLTIKDISDLVIEIAPDFLI